MLLRGKYRLGERIGAGAMAAVFAGTHVVTERPIAVKRLLPDRVRDDKAVARFEREARAAGRIRSEHVVEVLDFDRDEAGLPFLVLERLFGETLAERLRRRPPLEPGEAIDLGAQALAGVADMHRAGVIHRDIKPSNVFLCSGGAHGPPVVKLVDFGVAKVTDEPPAHLTNVDEMLGSFSFTAPEQLRSSVDAGPAADLWSIGVLLHRMLTGEQPFTADDPGSVMAAILERPAPRLADLGVHRDVAAQLQPIVDRALQKRPEDRHTDAGAMQRALTDAHRVLFGGSVRQPTPMASRPEPAAQPPLLVEADAADDAPTPHHDAAQPQRLDAATTGAPAAARLRPAVSAMLFGAAVGVGSLLGWISTAAPAGSNREAPPEPPQRAIVRAWVEPESAEVRLGDDVVPRDGAGALAIEVAGPGLALQVRAPGHVARTVELPVRSTAMHIRLERAGSAAPPAETLDTAASPSASSASGVGDALATDDDLQIEREAALPGSRPARPVRSAAGPARSARADSTRSRLPQPTATSAGGAPPPIRTAPY